MFRHHGNLLRRAATNPGWGQTLFQDVARNLPLPAEAMTDNGEPYGLEIDDSTNCDWAKSLAAPFGLPAEKLLVCHHAIVTGITEEFGSER